MLISLLIFDVALIAWALHLIQQAVYTKELSRMFAGILVSLSAGAMFIVYSLMGHCMNYLSHSSYIP